MCKQNKLSGTDSQLNQLCDVASMFTQACASFEGLIAQSSAWNTLAAPQRPIYSVLLNKTSALTGRVETADLPRTDQVEAWRVLSWDFWYGNRTEHWQVFWILKVMFLLYLVVFAMDL